jgi:hypothetical protein
MTLHIKDGGTWKSATGYVKDGGTWKQFIGYVKDAGTWKIFTATAYLANLNVINSRVSPLNAAAGVQINTDGVLYNLKATTYTSEYTWLTAGDSSSNYWVRWTNTSGTLSSGTAGSWLQLSSTREFSVEYTTDADGSKTCTGTLEIAADAAGATILATATITLNAVVTV